MARLTKGVLRNGLRVAVEIRNGTLPTAEDLGTAPGPTQWAIAENKAELPRFVGFVLSHPLLGSGWCTTSAVLVMAPDNTWARTVSRLDRMGELFLAEPR